MLNCKCYLNMDSAEITETFDSSISTSTLLGKGWEYLGECD